MKSSRPMIYPILSIKGEQIGIYWYEKDDSFPWHCESALTGNTWACDNPEEATDIVRMDHYWACEPPFEQEETIVRLIE